MTNIKEIQEFNRSKIICSVHNTEDYEEALRRDNDGSNFVFCEKCETFINTKETNKFFNYDGEPLTLSRVLLAMPKYSKDGKLIQYSILEKDWQVGDWFEGEKKHFVARMRIIFDCDCCEDFWEEFFIWDLEKETLEEQSSDTQISIAQLLGYAKR